MKWGEIRWYRFPSPDKRRPVLLLTRDSALEILGGVTIAPITTTIRDITSEVLLTNEDGLPRESVVNLDHVQTVPRGRLGGAIATLTSARMEQVRAALLFALGM